MTLDFLLNYANVAHRHHTEREEPRTTRQILRGKRESRVKSNSNNSATKNM